MHCAAKLLHRARFSWPCSPPDPQFNQPVKLKSLAIFSAISPEQAPKTIQLFINQPTLDFGDAANLVPTQEIVLSDKDVKGERIELRFVKFQNVNSLWVRAWCCGIVARRCAAPRSSEEKADPRMTVRRTPRRYSSRTTRATRRPRGSTRSTSSGRVSLFCQRGVGCFAHARPASRAIAQQWYMHQGPAASCRRSATSRIADFGSCDASGVALEPRTTPLLPLVTAYCFPTPRFDGSAPR